MPACLHIIKNAQYECTAICRIVEGLARHAADRGYRVEVLFLGGGPLEAALRAKGIPAAVAEWSGRVSDVAGLMRVVRWLRRHPVDVAHLHHGGTAARLLARAAGAHVVVAHLHSLPGAEEKDSARRQPFRGADAVIACSEAVAACYPSAHAAVIYAGVEVGASLPEPRPVGSVLQLGVLGRLVALKGVETAIAAAESLAKQGVAVELEIAGTGPAEETLRAQAVAVAAAARISFLGWRSDVGTLLASWDLLLAPSQTEGFPISVLEAMGAGRAVVASRVGGLCELVDDGVSGCLVTPGNVEELAACLAKLARDREILAAMGRAGWKRVRERFSAEQMAAQMLDLYDSLLPGACASRRRKA